MLLDVESMLSDGQAVTTGSVASTNTFDAGASRDVAGGEGLWVLAQVTEAFVGPGATLIVALETASEPTFAAPTTLYTSPAIAVTELGLGARPLRVAMPRYAQRYLRLKYTVSGTFSAGRLTAGLGTAPEDSTRSAYPRGAYGVA
jgi:hypothetical protein